MMVNGKAFIYFYIKAVTLDGIIVLVNPSPYFENGRSNCVTVNWECYWSLIFTHTLDTMGNSCQKLHAPYSMGNSAAVAAGFPTTLAFQRNHSTELGIRAPTSGSSKRDLLFMYVTLYKEIFRT
jgi:hypothetical protein